MATTSPAIGPAMPISSRMRLFLGGSFSWMKAPIVPNGLSGKGMKYGRVTWVLW